MENKGTITTYLTEDGFARLIFAETTGIVAWAAGRFTLSKTVTAALGRGLTAAALMGSTLKDASGSLTLRFRGNGPAGGLTCVCDAMGNVRGCADEPTAELPPNALGKLDVGGVIGREGELYVVRDYGFGEPYVGHVQLVSGEIAEDITNYYAVSEQTPTVCALGVRVNRDGSLKSAGGFLSWRSGSGSCPPSPPSSRRARPPGTSPLWSSGTSPMTPWGRARPATSAPASGRNTGAASRASASGN